MNLTVNRPLLYLHSELCSCNMCKYGIILLKHKAFSETHFLLKSMLLQDLNVMFSITVPSQMCRLTTMQLTLIHLLTIIEVLFLIVNWKRDGWTFSSLAWRSQLLIPHQITRQSSLNRSEPRAICAVSGSGLYMFSSLHSKLSRVILWCRDEPSSSLFTMQTCLRDQRSDISFHWVFFRLPDCFNVTVVSRQWNPQFLFIDYKYSLSLFFKNINQEICHISLPGSGFMGSKTYSVVTAG